MPLRRLRAEQSGFSLIELLVSMAIGSIVLTALLTVFLRGADGAAKVSDRVEAAQRGRLAMDRVVTLLNSQTCLVASDGSSQAPILDGQNDQVTFYANLGLVDTDPTKYRVRYDAATKRLWEDRFPPSRNAAGLVTYPASPGSSRIIGTNIVPVATGAPLFTYWQFVTDEGPTLGMINTTALSTPLSATDRANAVRVKVAFAAQPERTRTADLRSTTLEGTATLGSANPGEPAKGANC
jgi:prepilin-type N-terminal cleavage/methylation domain-containing protein